MKDWQPGVCDVCDILDQDKSEKRVYYCSFCRAWICETCMLDPIRRARAFYIRATQEKS